LRIDDLRTIPGGEILECDVCIIGSGPAGLTIARELAETNLRVVVLESGGLERHSETDALNDVDNVGEARVMDQWKVRNRILGGSSFTWSGRCAPFDPIDFAARPWVPNSEWPIDLGSLQPHLRRAAPYLGLGIGSGYTDSSMWDRIRHHATQAVDSDSFAEFFWQISKDKDSGFVQFGNHVASVPAPNVRVLVNATVTHLNLDQNQSRIESIEVAAADGTLRTVRGGRVVACAGGIENARILLASNRTAPNGVGNDHDMVGRYLMDHRRGAIGYFDPETSADVRGRFGNYLVKTTNGLQSFLHGIALTPEVQVREELLNCAVWISEVPADDDPWDAVRRVARRQGNRGRDVRAALRGSDLIAKGLVRRYVHKRGLPRKLAAVELSCIVEQVPDPDSRVLLSDRKDRFGVPRARIDWRIHEAEDRTVRRTAALAVAEFSRLGITVPEVEEWAREGSTLPLALVDVAHPTGATRMSRQPEDGVVDTDCRVHGISNLYVAGSSVFPTSGHANPTHMIVALSVRLADTLKNADRGMTLPETVETADGVGTQGPLVLVTGGTGRIGKHLLTAVTERGYRVRALTSKPVAERSDRSVEWRQHDWAKHLEFDEHVAGCDAVLHLGAEIDDTAKMWRTNVDATAALVRAAESAGVRFFGHVSSISVYRGSPRRRISEDSPLVTSDVDVKAECWGDERARTYARTKRAAELELRKAARDGEYVIFRPTVVVDVPDLVGLAEMSPIRRAITGYRQMHHVYVADVASCLIWFMEQSLSRSHPRHEIQVINLSNDDAATRTFREYFRQAYSVTKDERFATRFRIPGWVDWAREIAKYRTWPPVRPLGKLDFPPDALYSTGYQHPIGMVRAYEMAIEASTR
jgi:choline dehydrogenase-like flavoprotein/nucleoside-diphosphate-sugar epimerase